MIWPVGYMTIRAASLLVGVMLLLGASAASGKLPVFQVTIKTSPNPVPIGGTGTFTITVKNAGDGRATDVVVKDPAEPDCARNLGSMAAGASRTYTCTHPDVRKAFRNDVSVSGRFTSTG
jgi:uncharacterized repeat protein (TIGR01451 family)